MEQGQCLVKSGQEIDIWLAPHIAFKIIDRKIVDRKIDRWMDGWMDG